MEIDSRIRERAEAVSRALLAANRRVAVVESCTGGWVAEALTSIAGSSVWFDCALVTYSNSSKNELAGVPLSLIESVGAVSEEVALAMAEGIRKTSGADVGLSVTGVAGPGSSENKPAGTVFIAISDKNKSYSEFFHFYDNRTRNKERSAQAALDLLRRWLLNTM